MYIVYIKEDNLGTTVSILTLKSSAFSLKKLWKHV